MDGKGWQGEGKSAGQRGRGVQGKTEVWLKPLSLQCSLPGYLIKYPGEPGDTNMDFSDYFSCIKNGRFEPSTIDEMREKY